MLVSIRRTTKIVFKLSHKMRIHWILVCWLLHLPWIPIDDASCECLMLVEVTKGTVQKHAERGLKTLRSKLGVTL